MTRQTTSRIVLLLLMGAGAAMIAVATYLVLRGLSPATQQAAYGYLGFPNGLLGGLRVLENLSFLLIPIYFASMIGSEYGQDTWKNLLMRQDGRVHFLLAKLTVAVGGTILFFALTLLVAQILAGAGAALVAETARQAHLRPAPLTLDEVTHKLLTDILVVGPTLLVAAALATGGAILERATVAGILPAIAWTVGDSLLPRLAPELQNLSISAHANSLGALYASGKGSYPPEQSLLFIAIYALIPLVAAGLAFQRRDISG